MFFYLPDIPLNEGFLVVGNEEVDELQLQGSSSRGSLREAKRKTSVVNWSARDLDDCIVDLEHCKNELHASLTTRYKNCCHPSFKLISKCLDLHSLVSMLCGLRAEAEQNPYDLVLLCLYGLEEFKEIYNYVSSIPHLTSRNLSFHPALAQQQYDKIKSTVASIIWGDNFQEIGSTLFKIISDPLTGKLLSELEGDSFITEFTTVVSSQFELEASFDVKLSTSDGKLRVKFEESNL